MSDKVNGKGTQAPTDDLQQYVDDETGEVRYMTAEQAKTEGFRPAEEIAEIADDRIWQKTITPSRINAIAERCKLADGGRGATVLLFRCAGIIRGIAVETMPDKPDQEFQVLVGEFEADVYGDRFSEDGMPEILSRWAAPQCYLPGGFHEGMLKRLNERTTPDTPNPTINFNFEFASTPAPNPRGYRWIARNLDKVALDKTNYLVQSRMAASLAHVRPAGLPDLRSGRVTAAVAAIDHRPD